MTDQQRHHDRAVTWLAGYLRGRLCAGLDPYDTARHVIQALADEHWRCIPPGPAVAAVRRTDPATAADTAHRGAELARQLLAGQDAP